MFFLAGSVLGITEGEPYNPVQIKYRLSLALSNATVEPEKSLEIINDAIAQAEKAKDRASIHIGYVTKGRYYIENNQFDEALLSINQAFTNSIEAGLELQIHEAVRLLSQVHLAKDIKIESLDYLYRGLELSQMLKDTTNISWYLIQIPNVEQQVGNIGRAMEYALLAKTFFETNNSYLNYASSLLTLAVIHKKLGKFQLSKENVDIALTILQYNTDSLLLGNAYSIYARLSLADGKFSEAADNCQRAIGFFTPTSKIEYQRANSLLGEILTSSGDYTEALKLLTESAEVQHKSNDLSGLAQTYLRLANLHWTKKQIKKAIDYYEQSIRHANSTGLNDLVRQAYKGLSIVKGSLGDYKKAYKNLSHYTRITDSLFNIQKIGEASRFLEDAKLLEHQLEIQSKELELERRKELISQQKQKQFLLYMVIALFLGIIIFAIREFTQKKRANEKLANQKKELEKQKQIADRKTRDFTDSLNYAKRIQQAILRASLKLKEFFPESFLMLFPRDIVSGDFYWVKEKKNRVLFAIADCTGHGVPGALMSIIGTYGLNRLVNENNLTSPSEILNSINSLFEDSLEQQQGVEIFDGMDIALCSYNPSTRELIYAGANIPLFILRQTLLPQPSNNISAKGKTHTLYNVRPNKQPIGSYFDKSPFVNHSITLMENDIVYLFSDGFSDQFGGPEGRKFRSPQLYKLLCNLADVPLTEQKAMLEETFLKWKGKNNQVDDVSFMGIKISAS